MTILLTAIGSMSADAAIRSFRKMGEIILIGCDINPKAWLPNSASVDFFYQAPNGIEEGYPAFIREVCEKHKVEMLIPLTDPEVDILSEQLQSFEVKETKVCISNAEAISVCRDKLKLFQYFRGSETIKVIPTKTIDELEPSGLATPYIAKPRKGRSSEGIRYFDSLNSLEVQVGDWSNYIFQPVLKGEVITVDCVRSKTGKTLAIARKELKRTRTGAGLTVETFNNPVLSAMVAQIAERLDILGCVNMEFIFDGKEYYLMDINPRFSAGIVFSFLTGYDMCRNHIYAFQGKELEDFDQPAAYGIYAKQYHEVKL